MKDSTETLLGEPALGRGYLTAAQLHESRSSLQARVAKGKTIELYDVFVEDGRLTPDRTQDLLRTIEIGRGLGRGVASPVWAERVRAVRWFSSRPTGPGPWKEAS